MKNIILSILVTTGMIVSVSAQADSQKDFYAPADKFPKNPIGIKVIGHFKVMGDPQIGYYLSADSEEGERDNMRRFNLPRGVNVNIGEKYHITKNAPLIVTSRGILGGYDVRVSPNKTQSVQNGDTAHPASASTPTAGPVAAGPVAAGPVAAEPVAAEPAVPTFAFNEKPGYQYKLLGPKVKGLSIGMKFQDAIEIIKGKIQGKTDILGSPLELLGPFNAEDKKGPLAEFAEISRRSGEPMNDSYVAIQINVGTLGVIRADTNNAVWLISFMGPLSDILFNNESDLSVEDFAKRFISAYNIPNMQPKKRGGYEYKSADGVDISIGVDKTVSLEKIDEKATPKPSFD